MLSHKSARIVRHLMTARRRRPPSTHRIQRNDPSLLILLPGLSSSPSSAIYRAQQRHFAIPGGDLSPRYSSPDEYDEYDDDLWDEEGNEIPRSARTLNDDGDDGDTPRQKELSPLEKKRLAIREELDNRKGRLFTDPLMVLDIDEVMSNGGMVYDDLPDWDESVVSGLAKDLVVVYEGGVPTLGEMSGLALPLPFASHPAYDAKGYVKFFRRREYERLKKDVRGLCEPVITKVMDMEGAEERQGGIDLLYETVEEEMFAREGVRLGDKAKFGMMVERAIQEVLTEVNKQSQREYEIEEEEERKKAAAEPDSGSVDDSTKQTPEANENSLARNNTPLPTEKSTIPEPTLAERDQTASPIFMDVFKTSETDPKGEDCYPISGPARGIPEEWELAAHKTTKRIMLRRCIRDVATQLLQNSAVRQFYLDGPKGVGKSSALNALVSMARHSGYVVLFFPDGDVMTQRGYYVEPSPTQEGVFDLPAMAQTLNEQLMVVHGDQLRHLTVETVDLEEVYTPKQLKAVVASLQKEGEEEKGDSDATSTIPLMHVLQKGMEEPILATGAYRTAIKSLTSDPTLRFLMVVDELNTYYDGGQYYHEKYDFHVQKTIPPKLISLFDPFLNHSKYNNITLITAPTHSRSISPKVTSQLSNEMKNDNNVTIINVPRYSDVEARAMIAHYECTGIGRLRFDRGDVLGDDQELEYIKMVSGRLGNVFLRECIF